MRIFQSKQATKPTVVVATRNPQAIEKFFGANVIVHEVFSTGGLIHAIENNPALMVIDPETLVETRDFPLAAVMAALESAQLNGIPVISPQALIAEGVDFNALTCGKRAGIRYVLPRVVVVTGYGGGVGKTTLSLAMAKSFRHVTGLGTAVLEMGFGASSLRPRLGLPEGPSLYATVHQNAPAAKWQGVDVYPLSMREAQVLSQNLDGVEKTLGGIAKAHTLTVIDISPMNPFWMTVLRMADEVLVIATPSPDALAQSAETIVSVKEFLSANGLSLKPALVMNKITSVGEKIGMGLDASAIISFDENGARNLNDNLGLPVLKVFYPGFDQLAGKQKGR